MNQFSRSFLLHAFRKLAALPGVVQALITLSPPSAQSTRLSNLGAAYLSKSD